MGAFLLFDKRYDEAEQLFRAAGAAGGDDPGPDVGLGHLDIVKFLCEEISSYSMKPALLLDIAAEAQDRAGAERIAHRDHGGHDPVDPSDLFADDPVGEDVAERTPVLLGDHRAE